MDIDTTHFQLRTTQAKPFQGTTHAVGALPSVHSSVQARAIILVHRTTYSNLGRQCVQSRMTLQGARIMMHDNTLNQAVQEQGPLGPGAGSGPASCRPSIGMRSWAVANGQAMHYFMPTHQATGSRNEW